MEPEKNPGAKRRRRGSNLLKAWAFASVVYVLVAGGLSIGPVREAIDKTHHQSPAPRTQSIAVMGPVPEAQDTPGEVVAKVVAQQAALTFAPPLLVLWFGWDVWFALLGFLPARRHDGEDSAAVSAEPSTGSL